MLTIEVLYRFIKVHPIETALISLASIITIISLSLQLKSTNSKQSVLSAQTSIKEPSVQSNSQPTTKNLSPTTIFVDVSGAVKEPDVYEVESGVRLEDVIELAGGLSEEADKRYVSRNYNLAKFVGDQEKIYIPYTWDIINGTFVEQKRILEYLQPLYLNNDKTPLLSKEGSSDAQSEGGGLTISINDASKEELETLPGIGPVTAQKIIDNRPYTSLDELLSRKVVNQSTFEKIKEFIEL
ncbi:hypothetical protein COU87_04430 [Candidatus Roizmanbacteria bacterium CG10_big_fil_rev_8_21_14_0_10_39_12]|uniref:Helix-hairpin-helix DNA-binding motif class 1 domain-containing protein n=1 Tax=Candidatus Roizmanbacteria bacterium CG10_big_fil_rev_8_21_14_0_10_39_12 TaxID=1974852 RepID=A0A2M8KNI9_9BACT|nr:MAG: hypothetical protein COU87_04430 [Candidatus Roizmanbacteria bacterium CG10_big_fil_rev_8_21_14_0_10_39_12]